IAAGEPREAPGAGLPDHVDRVSTGATGLSCAGAADGPAAVGRRAGRTAVPAGLRDHGDGPVLPGGPGLCHEPRGPDRDGALRPGRLADLLLDGDQAVFLRPGTDPGGAAAGRWSAADAVDGSGADGAEPAPGPRRPGCRRRLVLVPPPPGPCRNRDLPDRGDGDAPGMATGLRPGGGGPGLGPELCGLLRGLTPDPEQGALHLDLVGLRLLADPPALARRV